MPKPTPKPTPKKAAPAAMVPLPRPPLSPPAHALERLPEEWGERMRELDQPRYRGAQVFQWIHQRCVVDPARMTNLPKALRAALEEELCAPLALEESLGAEDGTHKLLFREPAGRQIESVLIPMADPQLDSDTDPDDEPCPVTQCISTQVGCAMGCVFCASGIAGLKKHLSAAEIVSQVILGRAFLRDLPDPSEGSRPPRLRNIVLMGMGEPLHNYEAVKRALVLMMHADGLAFGKRRVTLSTSGLVPEIDRLGEDFGGQIQLAISLHVPDDERRSALMPINRRYPLAELMAALRRYPLPRRRRITFEYTLVAGYNDDPADAEALAALIRGLPAKVNLIPLNPVPDNPLRPPSWAVVESFQERLFACGVPTFVRKRRGDEIAAACGQLALRGEKRKIRVALPTIGGG